MVGVHLPDVIAAYSDPTNAHLGPCNTKGTAAIFALHLYHIVFYQPLVFIDWVSAGEFGLLIALAVETHLHCHLPPLFFQLHHVVMVVVMLPMAYCLAPGHMLGHGAFYASGLPGAVQGFLSLTKQQQLALASS